MPKVIFVSGIHGVGKSTLCKELSSRLGFNHYSCSQIIKDNSDYIETSKLVSGINKNQASLLRGISLIEDEVVLLDGHFCLLEKDFSVRKLSFDIFDNISPFVILNVTCDELEIHSRLKKRDIEVLKLSTIKNLQDNETTQANLYCADRPTCNLLSYESPRCIERTAINLISLLKKSNNHD
ncbi:ATP-binding protein [Enterovibrio norvegicus]|uniref:ATP-binding protein n=1 Tax=Enterovibrio norvegicus TaxID=188144 RepID=UPI000CB82078|nr:ATP-binding protein [Enterovibrio norvegicus]PMH59646.1 hypothetical protein BCU62_22135 [Enterovibrio norvegicus]